MKGGGAGLWRPRVESRGLLRRLLSVAAGCFLFLLVFLLSSRRDAIVLLDTTRLGVGRPRAPLRSPAAAAGANILPDSSPSSFAGSAGRRNHEAPSSPAFSSGVRDETVTEVETNDDNAAPAAVAAISGDQEAQPAPTYLHTYSSTRGCGAGRRQILAGRSRRNRRADDVSSSAPTARENHDACGLGGPAASATVRLLRPPHRRLRPRRRHPHGRQRLGVRSRRRPTRRRGRSDIQGAAVPAEGRRHKHGPRHRDHGAHDRGGGGGAAVHDDARGAGGRVLDQRVRGQPVPRLHRRDRPAVQHRGALPWRRAACRDGR